MALSELQLDLIGKYISNTLSESEKTAFDGNLNNELFRYELLQQGQLVDALSDAQDSKLKKYLNESTYNSDKKNKRFFLEPFVKYAAVFIFLMAAFFLFKQFSWDSKHDVSTLISEYNIAYPAELIQRGNGAELSKNYKSALALYANNNYENALIAFNSLPGNDAKIELYLANIHIELEDYEKAVHILSQKWISPQNENLTDEILQNQEWYLAIALLGNEKINEAIDALEKIVNNKNHLFNTKAKNLLDKLS